MGKSQAAASETTAAMPVAVKEKHCQADFAQAREEEWQRRCAETTARLKETEGELTMVQQRLTKMGALLETAAGQRTAQPPWQAQLAEERRLRQEAEDKLWAERRRCQDLEGILSEEHRARREAEARLKDLPAKAPQPEGPAELQRLRASLASERKARSAAEALAKSVAAEPRGGRAVLEERARKAPAKSASAASKDDLERIEVRSRILQSENAALRLEAFQQRQRLREQEELQLMAAEEMRARKMEVQKAAVDVEKLQILLKESHVARQTELSAIVKNMCASKSTPAVQWKAPVVHSAVPGAVEVRGRLGGC